MTSKTNVKFKYPFLFFVFCLFLEFACSVPKQNNYNCIITATSITQSKYDIVEIVRIADILQDNTFRGSEERVIKEINMMPC